jgi:hypothetical protein
MESRITTLIDEDDNEFVVRTPRDDDGGAVDEPAHHKLIVGHWQDIAAASYLGFKRYGIGAVIVQERDSRADDVQHDFEAHSLSYAPANSNWIVERSDGPSGQWLDDQFQSYDPNDTALVLFTENGTVYAYAVDGTPDPPYAFKLSRAQYN